MDKNIQIQEKTEEDIIILYPNTFADNVEIDGDKNLLDLIENFKERIGIK